MAKRGIVPISKKHLANRDLGAGAVDKTVDLGQRWWLL